jgi:argininosuccinate synthase
MRILLAYSGGLDTSFLVSWFAEQGHEVHTCTVDCGGLDEAGRADLATRARALGARSHRLLDARERMVDEVIRWLVAGNVRRGGTYPLSVGAERGLQATLLVQLAAEERFDALAHGCTAAGNDQVRFDGAIAALGARIEVLAPIRDQPRERAEQIAWLQERGLPLPPAGGRYSVNAGLWGLTIGGGETLGSESALPEAAWRWTRDARATRSVEVEFTRGMPTALDGHRFRHAHELIETLNREAGACGVGRGYHLGDTVLGIKGRIGYEAPAAEVLLNAHRELEKLVLVEDQRFWKDQLGEVYGRKLHQGLLHDPFLRDVEAFLASSQGRVTGLVRVHLIGGRALVEGVSSPFSMMAASDAAYGERPAADASPEGAARLARVLAEPARLARRAALRAALASEDGAATTEPLREGKRSPLSMEGVVS